MKKLKKIGWGILVLLAILLVAGLLFKQSLKPDYEGEKKLAQLSKEVQVYYDAYGIPHIYGATEEDAFRALGYVHAQDRLWQMELLRRVAIGGLSEVFGADMINTDRFFLSLGIDDATATTVKNLDPNSPMVKIAEAYLDGINNFIAEGPTPIEFYLTGLDKQEFTINDIYNSLGYMGFSFAMAHKTDPLLTSIKNNLGPTYLTDLEIHVDENTQWIKNHPLASKDHVEEQLVASVNNALEPLPIPQFIGSNSWVLGPDKTTSGSVILANDPHIGFAQPSVWYEAHVVTPTYEKYGYHLAGIPFPLLGHDRNLAYGLTMFENDDVDFYYEEAHPSDENKYKTPDGWENYKSVTKTIKVKGEDDVEFTFKKSKHGPILNGIANQITEEQPISMSWIYTQVDNEVMDALHGISHADGLESFQSFLPKIHAPGLNVMYGDAKGNVAWWATAKLYQLPDSVDSKLILSGSSGKDERLRFLEFSENPHAINPPWNYVYSANNQPDSIAGMQYPGYYLPENRAKRIVSLLDPKDDWSREDVAGMITDVTSSVNPSVIVDLAKLVDVTSLTDAEIRILDKLNNWDGTYDLQNTQAIIYHRWIYFYLKNTFEDELGEDGFKQFLTTHLVKRIIAPLAKKPASVWWDNKTTQEVVETQQEIIHLSFTQALESLRDDAGEDPSAWTWDKFHTIEHEHPIGQVAAFRSFFNVGPFPVHGGREVINNLGFSYANTSTYTVGSGPSTRRIIDFSDVDSSMSILPTGQSGNPFSQYYKDQAEMFVNGEFRPMLMNKEVIESTANSMLRFVPGE